MLSEKFQSMVNKSILQIPHKDLHLACIRLGQSKRARNFPGYLSQNGQIARSKAQGIFSTSLNLCIGIAMNSESMNEQLKKEYYDIMEDSLLSVKHSLRKKEWVTAGGGSHKNEIEASDKKNEQ